MDHKFTVFPGYVNGSNAEFGTRMTNYFTSGFNYHVFSPDLSSVDVPFVLGNLEPATVTPSASFGSSEEILCSTQMGWRWEGDSLSQNDGNEPLDPVLKYATQMLMEEDNENMRWEYKDQLALRDTELSLYQALGEKYTPPINQPHIFENLIVGGSDKNGSNSRSTPIPGTSSVTANLLVGDGEDHKPSLLQDPHFKSTSKYSAFTGNMGDGLMLQSMLNDVESSLQFKRGYEEARKFIPQIDLGSNNADAKLEMGICNAINNLHREGSRGRKNRDREERDLEEEKSTKQPAIFVEDSELHELFDKMLLFDSKPADEEAVKGGTLETNKRPVASKGGKAITKMRVKEDPVDLKDLLILCARAVFFSDHRTSSQLLKQIREHASPFGDGSQRLAHYFANGLEARMNGSGTRIQNFRGSLASTHTTSADILKAINCIFKALPFELSVSYANKSICKMAENAKALHIVDFGISFVFQWPNLIELLSVRDGGPPKLRITVIELPQRGFRPSARVEETGKLLASYCERFNVPFEFNCIAMQDWKTLPHENLKIDGDEIVVANNLCRFESLLDETDDGVECPRDAVLRIIRSMNPDIFVHSVINGSFNGPFFVSRFKEALFYYSSIFDLLDTAVSLEEVAWLMYESHYYGSEIMNVVACEGSERIFRPESYKQWQVRNLKAGFKPLPLDQARMQGLREQLKTKHHKDFSFDEDGPWILQGWKGRTSHACSFWVRATPASLDIVTHS